MIFSTYFPRISLKYACIESNTHVWHKTSLVVPIFRVWKFLDFSSYYGIISKFNTRFWGAWGEKKYFKFFLYFSIPKWLVLVKQMLIIIIWTVWITRTILYVWLVGGRIKVDTKIQSAPLKCTGSGGATFRALIRCCTKANKFTRCRLKNVYFPLQIFLHLSGTCT